MKKILSISLLAAIILATPGMVFLPISIAFTATEGEYTYEIINGEAIITKCNWAHDEIEVPYILGGYPVTGIGDAAFRGRHNLTTILIPSSVTNIGNSAFYQCSNLSSVTIGNSVVSIGDSAFYQCSRLASLNIPDSVLNIMNSVFFGCNSLTSITFGSGLKNIGNDILNCENLIDIEVSSNNMSYSSQNGVLFNKNRTTLIIFPRGKGGSYSIPNSVTDIKDNAFKGCNKLNNINIVNGVTNIGDDAFRGCSGLISIAIPGSVISVANTAFSGCDSLTNIEVSNENLNYFSIDGVLFNKNNTVLIIFPAGKSGSYTIPSTVTDVGYLAFERCFGITSITIPDSVTNIGDGTFGGCMSLTSIIIPNSVTSIGFFAFVGCTSLNFILIPDSVTSIGEWSFFGCDKLTIYCFYDSCANEYASINNIPFFILSNETVNGEISKKGYTYDSVYVTVDYKFVLQNCYAFIAIYDGNKLVGLSSTFVPKGSEYSNLEANCNLKNKAYTIKIIFMENQNNIMPLSMPLVTSISVVTGYYYTSPSPTN